MRDDRVHIVNSESQKSGEETLTTNPPHRVWNFIKLPSLPFINKSLFCHRNE